MVFYDWLLAPEKPDASAVLSDICQAIVEAQSATDAALRPLVRLLDAKQLPSNRTVSAALNVLAKTRGEAVPAITAILDTLETTPPPEKELVSDRTLALWSASEALTSVPNDAARDRLLEEPPLRLERREPTPRPRRLEEREALGRLADGRLPRGDPGEHGGRRPHARRARGLRSRAREHDRSLVRGRPAAWHAYIQSLRH